MGAGTTPINWGQEALNFGQQAAGGIMGMIMGNIAADRADKRQIRQQRKLMDMQMQGNMKMLDYSKMKDLEMWKNTMYPAQLEQMKAAGLSPGLMYGTSGGGGTTIGGGGQSVSGAHAPVGGGEGLAMMQQGMTLAMMRAQTENIKANTNKTNKEAENVPLTGKNIQANTLNTEQQTRLAAIQEKIAGATIEEAIQKAVAEMAIMQQEVLQQEVKTEIGRATKNDQIDQIKANVIATLLGHELTRAQTTTEKGKPAVQTQEIESMKAHITAVIMARMQKWREIEISGQNANTTERDKLNQLTSDLNKELNAPFEVIEKIVQAIILKNIISPSPGQPFWKKGTERR